MVHGVAYQYCCGLENHLIVNFIKNWLGLNWIWDNIYSTVASLIQVPNQMSIKISDRLY